VGHDESVGGGVQVGNINVDLLVLQSGHGADLGNEEDDVAHVDVVAEAVEDEEQVGPVLSGARIQWGGLGFDLLLFLFRFLHFLWFIVFGFSVLLGNFSDLCSRLCSCLVFGVTILLSGVTVLCCGSFSIFLASSSFFSFSIFLASFCSALILLADRRLMISLGLSCFLV